MWNTRVIETKPKKKIIRKDFHRSRFVYEFSDNQERSGDFKRRLEIHTHFIKTNGISVHRVANHQVFRRFHRNACCLLSFHRPLTFDSALAVFFEKIIGSVAFLFMYLNTWEFAIDKHNRSFQISDWYKKQLCSGLIKSEAFEIKLILCVVSGKKHKIKDSSQLGSIVCTQTPFRKLELADLVWNWPGRE